MAARVLAVQRALDVDDVEWVVAPDGETACSWAEHDVFDSVVVDLSLPVSDGWLVLASLGAVHGGPRLIAMVADRADVSRAHQLGADLCLLAGTVLHARALQPAWRRHHAINSRRPTTSGARA